MKNTCYKKETFSRKKNYDEALVNVKCLFV